MTPSRTPRTDAPTVTVSVRMTPELKASLQDLARADDRTLNWYIVRVLTDHADQTAKVAG